MAEMSAAAAAAVTAGAVHGDSTAVATRFVADSREVAAGDAFIAIRGGHEFVGEAIRRGARFVVVERPAVLPAHATGIVVGSTEEALARLASDVRSRLGSRIVGITGSTGKTITKDLLAAAAGAALAVHATPGNYNAEIGVPLTLLACPRRAQVVVCEMAARRPGEIAELARIARPDVGIVTGIGISHLELFKTRDAIARTKAELVAALPPRGIAILPSADDYLGLLASSTQARVLTVGPGGHVRAVETATDADGHVRASVAVPGHAPVAVRVPVAGRAMLRNAMLALAAAVELGVPPDDAAGGLAAARPTRWRMEVLRTGGRIIVNDAYNANPTSTGSALRTVRELAGTRPAWAVLGEMAELGGATEPECRRVGRLARALGFDRVVVVGAGAAPIAAGAGPAAVVVTDAAAAAELVGAEAPHDAVVLVKGSRVAGLEATAAALAGDARVEV